MQAGFAWLATLLQTINLPLTGQATEEQSMSMWAHGWRIGLRVALAATPMVLAACAPIPYLASNPTWYGFKPTQIELVEKEDPGPACGAAPYSVLGCAVRQRQQNQCTVFIKSELPYRTFSCVVTHETRHCVGDDHLGTDGRPNFAVDCGTGELYSGPVRAPG